MEKFTRLAGVAAPMLSNNIDTDTIIPVARMKMTAGNFAEGLFANKRFLPDGSEDPQFVLNQPPYRRARILVAGSNFGCGSSREHAVWALLGFGIRCVIAESFGDIFLNNSFAAGLLPVTLAPAQLNSLGEAVTRCAGSADVVVDLENNTVTDPDGAIYPFQIDPMRRRSLLKGLDSIGTTLLCIEAIESFQAKDRINRPWVYEISPADGAPREAP